MSENGKIIVTKLRFEDGYWKARVSLNGVTIDVDRRFGSWLAVVRERPGARSFKRLEVSRAVAAALQAKVAPLEKKRAAETAA